MATLVRIVNITLTSLTEAKDLYQIVKRIYQRIKNDKKLNLLLLTKMLELDDAREEFDVFIKLARPILESQTIQQPDKERLKRKLERIKRHRVRMDELIDEMIANSSSILDARARHKARDELREMGSTKELSNLFMKFREDVLALKESLRDEHPTFLSDSDFTPIDVDNILALTPSVFLEKGRLTTPRNGIPSTVQWFLYESKPYDADHRGTAKNSIAHSLTEAPKSSAERRHLPASWFPRGDQTPESRIPACLLRPVYR